MMFDHHQQDAHQAARGTFIHTRSKLSVHEKQVCESDKLAVMASVPASSSAPTYASHWMGWAGSLLRLLLLLLLLLCLPGCQSFLHCPQPLSLGSLGSDLLCFLGSPGHISKHSHHTRHPMLCDTPPIVM
jgi:hypothetical protein